MANRRARGTPRRGQATHHAPPSLRIIGGAWRSRRLPIADRPGLRPTPDRIRETLFNWLAPRIAGARCADLFAGSGALGLEALSRGAAWVSFFDTDRVCADGLRGTLTTLAATDRAELVIADATQAAIRLAAGSVDIAFVDPPFAARLHGAALASLHAALTADARVYLEYPAADADTIAAEIGPDYDIVRSSRAAGVGFCLATPRRAGDD